MVWKFKQLLVTDNVVCPKKVSTTAAPRKVEEKKVVIAEDK